MSFDRESIIEKGSGYDDLDRLYEWLISDNREPAQTFFTAGKLRTLAKEIEFQINQKKKDLIIPKSFKLFGTTVNVVFDNKRMNDLKSYGFFEYSLSRITLSTTDGVDELSNDRIVDCFYHERTHSILDAMRERELSNNEKFVDVFSKLLRQAVETSEF